MVGRNLKNLREKSGFSQADLAKKLGVSRQAVCMWESDKRELNISTLIKVSDIFGVSIDEIIRPGKIMPIKTAPKAIFGINAPSAKEVLLIGDFNAWDKNGIPLKRNSNGLWKIELELKPGNYEYKFIVDGNWQNDPVNKDTILNSFGSSNSVKKV